MNVKLRDHSLFVAATINEWRQIEMLGRFFSKIRVAPTGCWEWRTISRKDGRGIMAGMPKEDGRATLILGYRFAYETFKGPINGLNVCHKCDNPSCVNPEHLFLGTTLDNNRDSVNKGRARGPAKLTREQVHEIRRLYATSCYPLKILGNLFKVSEGAIYGVVRFKNWKYLKPSDSEKRAQVARICKRIGSVQWKEIHKRYNNGERPTDLAREFGVTANRIIQIGKHVVEGHGLQISAPPYPAS